MDRKGVMVSSGVQVEWLNGHIKDPNILFFDGPFLIVLSKRGLRQPFFVMWVDNAELLQTSS
jgi:hypothetical protein